tara:strand:+ start:192 stop:821 length:630 start_codon:yes stop_codon:yes gene_type:complete
MVETIYNITSNFVIKRIKFIRKIYILFSIFIGILSPLVCLYFAKDVNLTEKPLSYFALVDSTSIIWFISLIIIAIGLFWNGNERINQLIKNKKYKLLLKLLLITSSFSLIGTATITMKFELAHKLFAASFFLIYNFFVFLFGLIRSLSQVREGFFSVTMGSLMLLSILLLIPFPSYGVAEIVYIQLCICWNLVLFIKGQKINKKKDLLY